MATRTANEIGPFDRGLDPPISRSAAADNDTPIATASLRNSTTLRSELETLRRLTASGSAEECGVKTPSPIEPDATDDLTPLRQ